MGKSPALQAQRLFENLLHGPSSALPCGAYFTYARTSRTELTQLATAFKKILRTWGHSMNPRYMASQHGGAIGRLKFKTLEPRFSAKKAWGFVYPRFLDD